jgi:hypothetical protein
MKASRSGILRAGTTLSALVSHAFLYFSVTGPAASGATRPREAMTVPSTMDFKLILFPPMMRADLARSHAPFCLDLCHAAAEQEESKSTPFAA